MSSTPVAREQRRSTRVSLKVTIEVHGVSEPLTCDGETILVNLHGALISMAVALKIGTIVQIEVYPTGKTSQAMVCYVDPAQSLHCGIALAKPENIWGISLRPDDWLTICVAAPDDSGGRKPRFFASRRGGQAQAHGKAFQTGS